MANMCPCSFGNSISAALLNLKNAKKLNGDAPEQSAQATVLSRRVKRTNDITMYQESPWVYWLRFRLENGEELELQTSEEEYRKLNEGKTLTISWRSEHLVSFVIPLE